MLILKDEKVTGCLVKSSLMYQHCNMNVNNSIYGSFSCFSKQRKSCFPVICRCVHLCCSVGTSADMTDYSLSFLSLKTSVYCVFDNCQSAPAASLFQLAVISATSASSQDCNVHYNIAIFHCM